MTFTLPARPSVLWSSSQQPHEEMSQSNIIFHHPMQFLTSQSGDKISHCTLSILFSTRLGTMSRKKGFMIELQGLSWKIKNRFNMNFTSKVTFSFPLSNSRHRPFPWFYCDFLSPPPLSLTWLNCSNSPSTVWHTGSRLTTFRTTLLCHPSHTKANYLR